MRVVASVPGAIQIEPVNPAFIYIPTYNPGAVFVPRRPGVNVGGVISFGHGVTLGLGFQPWGWGAGVSTFQWTSHRVITDRNPWNRRGRAGQGLDPFGYLTGIVTVLLSVSFCVTVTFTSPLTPAGTSALIW